LVRDVDVFLFDEPLSNLDAKLRSELRVEIKRLHARLENTMIYVTHDQIEALTLADRIAVMKGGIIQQLADPRTIYNKPSNLFVAGFIGSPAMSFLDGAISGGTFKSGDVTIALDGYDGGALVDNGNVKLGLRPEHIEVSTSPTANSVPAIVDVEEPMGSDSLLWVSLGGHPVSVRIDPETRHKRGAEVHLSLDISKSSIFDMSTELRL